MEKLRQLLTFESKQISIKHFLLLVVIAYIAVVAIRFYWVDAMSGNPGMMWNDQLMINTNDGYFWAEGARDILRGEKYYAASPTESPVSILTAFVAKLFPISLETVMLYLPAIIGSLLVLPIMLMGRVLKQDYIGFGAAVFGAIAWSYYNRTMAGYFDTDMFVVVLPTFIVWGMVMAMIRQNTDVLIFAPLFAAIAIYWHTSGMQISNALFMTLMLYTLLFERKNIYSYKLLILMMLALMQQPFVIKVIAILIVASLFHFFKERLPKKYVLMLGIGAVLAYLYFGGFQWLMSLLQNAYITRALHADSAPAALKFFSVVQTVREAGSIPFEIFANRISGHTITFIVALLGYLMLLVRFPVMLISVPMVVLGFFAFSGGLRFTVFSVPFMALGLFFIIFWIGSFLKDIKTRSGFIVLASCIVLYPNIKHITDYMVPTVFSKDEVAVLDQLNKVADRKDYVVSWWDYGYPIRFYADVNTLVDGGKHNGYSNFPVSYSLTYPQIESANMARLDTEYDVMSYEKRRRGSLLQHMMEDYGYTDSNVFLESLKSKSFMLPEKTRDVYYFLPMRMLNIYQTVRLFSNRDLQSGRQYADPFLYVSNGYKDVGEKIFLGNNIVIDKKKSLVVIGGQEIPINNLIVTVYDSQGKLQKQVQTLSPSAPISIIFMKSYNKFIVVDNQTLASTFFQLFILENYDPELFEPVILSPLAKVYRLKK